MPMFGNPKGVGYIQKQYKKSRITDGYACRG